MAAAGMKEIKRRMKSIESTMQITKAMELVASSKLRRAREQAEASFPFFHALYETMSEIVAESADFDSVYTKVQTEGPVLLIVIAGDRGLAGGFNGNAFKLARKRIEELEAAGREPVLLPIGKKTAEHFERTGLRIFGSFSDIAGTMTVYRAMDLAERILAYYNRGQITGAELIFNDYVSPLTQEPRQMTVLPLPNLETEAGVRSGTNYEPSPEAVFAGLVPGYLSGMLYCAIVDSYAAEQAARRLSMQNATDNAAEMLSDLSLLYNRARQAAITQEITEIVGGANAQL